MRLSSMLVELLPDEPGVRGMLALHLGIGARNAARRDHEGRFVPLALQDVPAFHLCAGPVVRRRMVAS